MHRISREYTPPTLELLRALNETLRIFNQVFLIIDVLDEYIAREELFLLLEIMRGWKITSFNILVTSKDEPNIREYLSLTIFEDISLINIAVDQDIRVFVTRILEKDPKFRKWPDLHQETESSLPHGAKGMFDGQIASSIPFANASIVAW